MASTPSSNAKDGWPARIRRSLALGGSVLVLGRKRAIRDRDLIDEEFDAIPLNAAGDVKTESPRPVEAILEDILAEMRTMNENILNIR
mgnify:CR=1 FL=1